MRRILLFAAAVSAGFIAFARYESRRHHAAPETGRGRQKPKPAPAKKRKPAKKKAAGKKKTRKKRP